MKVSVVIPSFNGVVKLRETIKALLKSDVEGIAQVELVVVDDGSPNPLAPLVAEFNTSPPFTLCYIRQNNRGPAAARNAGFRASQGEVVIFIDDDILCPPLLIKQHIRAHAMHPLTVICGRCPFVKPGLCPPLLTYINSLRHDGIHHMPEFKQVAFVASGQISVERSMFDAQLGVYGQNLATPAAEEFELALRLRERGIQIVFAPKIVALHNHIVTIENMSRQAYKHGLGCAEVAVKYPATLCLPDLQNIIQVNRPIQRGEPLGLLLKKVLKQPWAGVKARARLLQAVQFIERKVPHILVLAPLYRAVLGLHLCAGVRDGYYRYCDRGVSV